MSSILKENIEIQVRDCFKPPSMLKDPLTVLKLVRLLNEFIPQFHAGIYSN